ncbi:hypothetical protein GCM10009639_14320 [Kitasatospora putterlickiae]|uniref:Uncharacterized protein n=1 Tax=Kitasatospora putterlickiae TaxID=221725 RepID=A0ABP4IDT3_9ACTN
MAARWARRLRMESPKAPGSRTQAMTPTLTLKEVWGSLMTVAAVTSTAATAVAMRAVVRSVRTARRKRAASRGATRPALSWVATKQRARLQTSVTAKAMSGRRRWARSARLETAARVSAAGLGAMRLPRRSRVVVPAVTTNMASTSSASARWGWRRARCSQVSIMLASPGPGLPWRAPRPGPDDPARGVRTVGTYRTTGDILQMQYIPPA